MPPVVLEAEKGPESVLSLPGGSSMELGVSDILGDRAVLVPGSALFPPQILPSCHGTMACWRVGSP